MLHLNILNHHVLSMAIWLPILAGIVVLLLGSDNKAIFTRWLALAGSLAAFFATLPLYTKYDFSKGAFQFEEMVQWIPSFNINYHLGVDGIAVPLILLTSFTTVIVVIAAWEVITKNIAQYMADVYKRQYLHHWLHGRRSGLYTLFQLYLIIHLLDADAGDEQ